MRKLLAVVLILCSIVSVASADTDLKSMPFDDLLSLRDLLTAEIMSRPEWKEVEVPAGKWIIGEDIPEGYYSIRALDKTAIAQSAPAGSAANDFYHVIGKGKEVGKEFFKAGNIFDTSSKVILAPPKGLGF